MHLIKAPLNEFDPALSQVSISVERRVLARRLWRSKAEDGTDFGFELDQPLKDGATVWQENGIRYVIKQLAEPVLEVSLGSSASEAALLGWTIGNLHFEIEVRQDGILSPDDPALRQTLERAGIPFTPVDAVFHPQRSGGHGHHHGHQVPFLPLHHH